METDRDIFIHNDARGYNSSSGAPNLNLNNAKLVSTGIPSVQVPEDDDFPLYDSVASDEDLFLIEQQTILAQQVRLIFCNLYLYNWRISYVLPLF